MAVEGVEVLRKPGLQLRQPACRAYGHGKDDYRYSEKYGALYHVRHKHAPESARKSVCEDDGASYPEARLHRNARKDARHEPQRVQPDHVVENPERDSAPADELPHPRAVAALQVFHRRVDVGAAPATREHPCPGKDGKRAAPEHYYRDDPVRVRYSAMRDEHERADHSHVGAYRAHPPRHLLSAGEEVAGPLHEPAHEEADGHRQREIRRDNRPIEARQSHDTASHCRHSISNHHALTHPIINQFCIPLLQCDIIPP